ncbi:MAG: sigma-70 family RNA polymerase sigma factor [Planctomycetes bacterium]|nr:sigma-70 family RNA polymerase sigma factor [Planctomycetota bacterium]
MSPAADNPNATLPVGRDAETVALLRRRDQQGLRQLLADHGGMVRERLVRRFFPQLDHSEIDEALSKALHQVWLSVQNYDPAEGTLRSWFAVIAQRSASKVLARRRPNWLQLSDQLDEEAEPLARGGLQTLATHDLLHDTSACIDLLPVLQREILRADFAVRGTADSEQLATRFGTTPTTIYAARSQGLRSLRAMLQRSGHRIDPTQPVDQTTPLRAETG